MFGTDASKPPYIKISIFELDTLYKNSKRLYDLKPILDQYMIESSIKDSIICSQEDVIALVKEERDSEKTASEAKDNKIDNKDKVIESKDEEINILKKGKSIREILIVILAIGIIII